MSVSRTDFAGELDERRCPSAAIDWLRIREPTIFDRRFLVHSSMIRRHRNPAADGDVGGGRWSRCGHELSQYDNSGYTCNTRYHPAVEQHEQR